MRTRARSVLVVGLLAGGVLVALPAAGATESPPECEEVADLVEARKPSAALTRAQEIAQTQPPADPATVVCADELGDAEDDKKSATTALTMAQQLDDAATAVEPTDAEASAALREQADTKYAEALLLDVGLDEAIEGLAPAASGSEKVAAAEQLLALGYPDAAHELAKDAVKEGDATAEEAEQAGLSVSNRSLPDRLGNWWDTTAASWVALVALIVGAGAVGVAWVIIGKRPRLYDVQVPAIQATPGESVVPHLPAQWHDALVGTLVRLGQQDRKMRVVAVPDAELTLPKIEGMPTGFKAAIEFWTWAKQLRTLRVSSWLHVVNGQQRAHLTVRTRFGRLIASDDLGKFTSGATGEAACMSLVPAAAAWLAFQSTPEANRREVFGSESAVAVSLVAAAAPSDLPQAARHNALVQARVEDPTMLEARLNIAALETTMAGPAPFRLDALALAQGIRGLGALLLAVQDALGALPGEPGDTLTIDQSRLRALAMRARYNLVIAMLNWRAQDSAAGITPEAVTEALGNALDSAQALAQSAVEGPIRDTATRIRKHLVLLMRVHESEAEAFLENVEEILCLPPLVEPSDVTIEVAPPATVTVSGIGTAGGEQSLSIVAPGLVTISSAPPAIPDQEPIVAEGQFPEGMPAWVDYTVACALATYARGAATMAERRAGVRSAARWIYSATRKEPIYACFWGHDPYFHQLGLDDPLPDQSPVEIPVPPLSTPPSP